MTVECTCPARNIWNSQDYQVAIANGTWVHADSCATRSTSERSINHPKHYTSHPSGIECITIVEHMTFNVGNAIKYLWRAGLKDSSPSLEDLKKAQWYIAREIERLEKVKPST